MELFALMFAVVGAFYAGYQRGRRQQAIQDTAAVNALVDIAERLADQTLSGLGRDIRTIALDGLRARQQGGE